MMERSAFARGTVRRVLTPAEPPAHLFVGDFFWGDKLIYADAGGFRILALAANVAASSPHHLLYIPSGSLKPEGSLAGEGMPSVVLVFRHPHAGFRASDWKELRHRLGAATLVRKQAEFGPEKEGPWWQHGANDPNMVDISIHAATMFVTAGPDAFRAIAHVFDNAAQGMHRDYHLFERGVSLRDGHHRFRGRNMEIECVTWTRWI